MGQGHYQYHVVPFGLATTPRIFTKCMAVVATHLQQQRISVFPYIEDWLVVADTAEQVSNNLDRVLHL